MIAKTRKVYAHVFASINFSSVYLTSVEVVDFFNSMISLVGVAPNKSPDNLMPYSSRRVLAWLIAIILKTKEIAKDGIQSNLKKSCR